MVGCGSSRGLRGATRWCVVRDLRLLRVFAVRRGGSGWRGSGCGGCLGGVFAGVLAAVLEASRQLPELAGRQRVQLAELRELNARLAARDAGREAELEEARAALAVLQRMLSGRKAGKDRPEPAGGGDGAGAPAGDGPASASSPWPARPPTSRAALTSSPPGSARSAGRSASCRSPARPSCPPPARAPPGRPRPHHHGRPRYAAGRP